MEASFPSQCGACGKRNPPNWCGKCRNEGYCNDKCAQMDYVRHSKENCQAFSLVSAAQHALSNKNYRRVLFTTPQLQYVEMYLHTGQEIGKEVHEDTTQYFYIHGGDGVVRIDNRVFSVGAGSVFVVPPGVMHNVSASNGKTGLWLHTIYSPPHHPRGLVQKYKV